MSQALGCHSCYGLLSATSWDEQGQDALLSNDTDYLLVFGVLKSGQPLIRAIPSPAIIKVERPSHNPLKLPNHFAEGLDKQHGICGVQDRECA